MKRGARSLLISCAFIAAFCGGGCGGGGGGGGGGGTPQGLPLKVVKTTPPIFQLGMAGQWWITASGGTPPYAFSVLPGQGVPPAGMAILASGQVSGAPVVNGTSTVVVRVIDSAKPSSTATAQIVLQVGGFDVNVEGLVTPDPWTGTAYRLTSFSGAQPVTFQMIRSAAGSQISDVDPAAHAATYLAGPVPGADLLHVSRPNGEWTEIALDVAANPLPNADAIWGSTDVWWVKFEGKEDKTHPFTSDFDDALWRLGLRSPASVDARGDDADLYAKFYVEQQVLRRLNQIYLNGPDGTPAPAGLRISFPFEEPQFPHQAPLPGTQAFAAPGDYNVIGVQAGVTDQLWLGYSFLDGAANDHVESATPSSSGMRRGVFVDGLLSMLSQQFFSASLSATPIGAPDVPALKALVYGQPNPGGRYDEVKRVADAWANVLAIWTAHEIGHCLSLQHTAGIMLIDANWLATPGAAPAFIGSDVTILRAALPGAGR